MWFYIKKSSNKAFFKAVVLMQKFDTFFFKPKFKLMFVSRLYLNRSFFLVRFSMPVRIKINLVEKISGHSKLSRNKFCKKLILHLPLEYINTQLFNCLLACQIFGKRGFMTSQWTKISLNIPLLIFLLWQALLWKRRISMVLHTRFHLHAWFSTV